LQCGNLAPRLQFLGDMGTATANAWLSWVVGCAGATRGGRLIHLATLAVFAGACAASADPSPLPADDAAAGADAAEASAPPVADAGAKDSQTQDAQAVVDSGPPIDNSAEQLCVDTINNYRKSLNLPPYQRVSSEESCAASQGLADSKVNTPHSAFGQCGEWAQNECPGWPGPSSSMIPQCLAMMWAEGPGSDFSTHGHYINMSSTQYTKVACGFATASDGSIWAVQDFY
jgi:hypothetical protein